jgi:oligopeptide/dipeptide ABC transporter ATP-binding protein
MTLRIRHLTVDFVLGAETVRAVDAVDLDIAPGRVLGIVGESGSGKSTLALSLLRLIDPPGRIVEGEILFEGVNLLSLSESEMHAIRGRRIGLILQNPGTTLNPTMTIGEHLVETIQERLGLSRGDARARASEMLQTVHLADEQELLKKYQHQLSGGMKQRVMIALAMVGEPAVLVADEPTSALDVVTQAQILKLLRELNAEHHTTVILITHNLSVAADICDDVAVMYAGRIAEVGDVFSVFDHPAHPYTQGLLRAVPKIEDEAFPRGIRGDYGVRQTPRDGCVFAPRCEFAMEVCRRTPPPGFKAPTSGTVYCFLYGEEPERG